MDNYNERFVEEYDNFKKRKEIKLSTAKQARNKINKGEAIKENKELEEIKNLIIQEIDKGNCRVYLSNRSILNSTIVFLEQNGYKIETGGRYNEINTVISW